MTQCPVYSQYPQDKLARKPRKCSKLQSSNTPLCRSPAAATTVVGAAVVQFCTQYFIFPSGYSVVFGQLHCYFLPAGSCFTPATLLYLSGKWLRARARTPWCSFHPVRTLTTPENSCIFWSDWKTAACIGATPIHCSIDASHVDSVDAIQKKDQFAFCNGASSLVCYLPGPH